MFPRGAKDDCGFRKEVLNLLYHLYLLHPLKFYILRYVLYRTVIDYVYINEYIDLYNSNINTEIKNAFTDRSYDQKYLETIV